MLDRILRTAPKYQRLAAFFLLVALIAIEALSLDLSPEVAIAIAGAAGALGIARPSEIASNAAAALPLAKGPQQ